MITLNILLLQLLVNSIVWTELDIKSASPDLEPNGAVVVAVNNNLETLGILLSLGSDTEWILKNTNKSKDSYLLKLHREHFKTFKDHPAVKAVDSLSKMGIFGPFQRYWALARSPLPEFKSLNPPPPHFYLTDRSHSTTDSLMEIFADHVRKFYNDADLATFFKKHSALYRQVEKEVSESIPDQSFFIGLTNFYGEQHTIRFTIVPSPTMFSQWGFGHSQQEDPKASGKTVLGEPVTVFYQLLSHSQERPFTTWKEIRLDSGLGFRDSKYNFNFCVHEFGHSFVRFLDSADAKAHVTSVAYLNTNEIRKAMKDQGQDTSWSTVFEEHLVRSIEVLMLEKYDKREEAELQRKTESEQNGFIYFDVFLNAVRKYDTERKRYKQFRDYLPVIIQTLKDAGK